MENSIFPVLSIDPDESKWEDHLFDLTPVEKVGDMWFKREDKFAPLGYGGINGSKLRQAIWLVLEQSKIEKSEVSSLISGASIKSPQLCFPGDEMILLTNGRKISFEDAYNKGEKIKVYSKSESKLESIEIEPPFITKETDELVEIELEGGEIFRCTPEHLILTELGWKEAYQLTCEDNIIHYGL